MFKRKPFFFFFFLTTTFSKHLPLSSPDATSLLSFKSKADINNTLKYSFKNKTLNHCQWQGVVKCSTQNKVIHFVLINIPLNGIFPPNTLSNLDQLRLLTLQNTSLTGPIPDLSTLPNLKSIFLSHNHFSGNFPPSLTYLHRIHTIDLSHNNFTNSIPSRLVSLQQLTYLTLDHNRFNGTIPAFNQTSLTTFNVSNNLLSGAIPVTSTLSHFDTSSYSSNPGLCGVIVRKECKRRPTFFGPLTPVAAPSAATGVSGTGTGVNNNKSNNKWKRKSIIIGFSMGVFIVLCLILCFIVAVDKQRKKKSSKSTAMITSDHEATTSALAMVEHELELKEKVKRVQVAKSGNLVFCAGEAQVYSLDQLMRGSAELLGRGSLGTTYKAMLDNRLIVCVKRLDASKMVGTTKEVFERHMESVGGLRHPNLVPLRAYFQAKEERLIIYDYQPNGSLYSLIHG
ncbi:hypothetical protein ACFE04_006078 [Oxalis oulophora]